MCRNCGFHFGVNIFVQMQGYLTCMFINALHSYKRWWFYTDLISSWDCVRSDRTTNSEMDLGGACSYWVPINSVLANYTMRSQMNVPGSCSWRCLKHACGNYRLPALFENPWYLWSHTRLSNCLLGHLPVLTDIIFDIRQWVQLTFPKTVRFLLSTTGYNWLQQTDNSWLHRFTLTRVMSR